MKTKKNSRILEAVYETAKDLHACGLLTEERMKLYNEMCLEPVTLYLEHDVAQYLSEICQSDPEKLSVFVNDLLRKNIETAQHIEKQADTELFIQVVAGSIVDFPDRDREG